MKHEPVPPEVEIERAAKRLGVPLNAGQRQAALNILAAVTAKRFHLVTGYAGSGKTTLVQVVMLVLSARCVKMAGTAPTHKAVAVLSKKVKETGAEASFGTIQSLLGLKPEPQGDRLTFTRDKYAEPVNVQGQTVRRGISVYKGVEQFKPFGTYSMCTIIGADDPDLSKRAA